MRNERLAAINYLTEVLVWSEAGASLSASARDTAASCSVIYSNIARSFYESENRMIVAHRIQENWQRERVPIINGVLFSDGTLWSFEYRDIDHKNIRARFVKLRAQNPSILDGTFELAAIIETGRVANAEQDSKYSCGEGSHGGDGYIACSSLSDNHLRWIAFFEESNPFMKIHLTPGFVHATNNHGHIWSLDIENPRDISLA
jgi:hypothetical protein